MDANNEPKATLPTTTAERKNIPLVRGMLDYFPAALAEVAKVSQAGNDKHNPGQDMHWSRGKSGDHADCIARHLVDRGTVDPDDGMRHSAKVAWRALALLQEELEREAGAPLPRGARVDAPAAPKPEGVWRVQNYPELTTCGAGPSCPACYHDLQSGESFDLSHAVWVQR